MLCNFGPKSYFQIELVLCARSILKSHAWFQPKLHSTQFNYIINLIVLRTISGAGVLLKTYREIKSYKKKIEPCRFAYTSYKKNIGWFAIIYTAIRIQLWVPDDIVIDMCPLVDKWDKEYSQKFISE